MILAIRSTCSTMIRQLWAASSPSAAPVIIWPGRDDVKGSAQLVGDARGQRAHRLQAIGVAQLLQRSNPRRSLLLQLLVASRSCAHI